jgi:hypothetical protein
MSQPHSHIQDTIQAVTSLLRSWGQVKTCLAENAALGGDEGVRAYWFNPDGSEVAGREFSYDQFKAAVAALKGIDTVVQGEKATNLYSLKS